MEGRGTDATFLQDHGSAGAGHFAASRFHKAKVHVLNAAQGRVSNRPNNILRQTIEANAAGLPREVGRNPDFEDAGAVLILAEWHKRDIACLFSLTPLGFLSVDQLT